METRKLVPARKFKIGYFIQEQIEIRNWNVAKLSEILAIKQVEINLILEGKRPITIYMAKLLASVFETSHVYWLNLDSNYRRKITKSID